MPTITKLIAALFFACLAYFGAQAFQGGMPPGTQFGAFNLICAGIGLLCGWFVMGSAAGKGFGPSVGEGFRTSVTIIVFALFLFSIILMLRKAVRMRYDGPMDAIVDIFSLAIEHGLLVFRVEVLSVFVIGGVIGGLIAEWTKKRWD
jgi:hypothetical protein